MIEDEREETQEAKKTSQAKRLIEQEKDILTGVKDSMPSLNVVIPSTAKELSTAEIEAISELSTSSAVQKEKAKLAVLQANIDAVQSSSKSSDLAVNIGIESNTEQGIDLHIYIYIYMQAYIYIYIYIYTNLSSLIVFLSFLFFERKIRYCESW
jgi:hypothetical protein